MPIDMRPVTSTWFLTLPGPVADGVFALQELVPKIMVHSYFFHAGSAYLLNNCKSLVCKTFERMFRSCRKLDLNQM